MLNPYMWGEVGTYSNYVQQFGYQKQKSCEATNLLHVVGILNDTKQRRTYNTSQH